MLVFTSCTNNYIPKARVLATSLKEQHPDWEFCLLLGEEPPTGFDLEREPFDRLLSFNQLDIPNYKAWLFRHRVVEICTAAKGPALYYFLEKERHDKVVYIDPDIMVINSLSPLEQLLDTYDILLTPHLLAPQKSRKAIADNEICTLQHGVYNLGFVAVAKCGQGPAFATWWRDRLLDYCYDDIPNGLFTDQRWCDLAPAFFSNLYIIRDPGYNVASWNLAERVITQDQVGTFVVNNVPLRFYHFTGFDSGAGEIMTAIYGAGMPAVANLWQLYKEKLLSFDNERLKKCVWQYASFENGENITDDMRLAYRNRQDIQSFYKDPFVINNGNCFFYWYKNNKKHLKQQFAIKKRLNKFKNYPGKLKKLYIFTNDYVKENGMNAFVRVFVKIFRVLHSGGISELKHYVKLKYQHRKHDFNIHLPEETRKYEQLILAYDAKNDSAVGKIHELLNDISPDKPITLVLTISWGGGAADYLTQKLNHISQNQPVIVLTWDSNINKIVGDLEYKKFGAKFAINDFEELQCVDDLYFDDIWINNLVGWSLPNRTGQAMPFWVAIPLLLEKLTTLAQSHGSIITVFFHDHFAVCPHWSLLKPDLQYCGVSTDQVLCQNCLSYWKGIDVGSFSISQWRFSWQKFLQATPRIRFFSQATRDIVEKVLTLPADHISVVPHSPLIQWNQIYQLPVNAPMTIGVIGSIYGVEKGSAMIKAISKLLSTDERLVVIGSMTDFQSPKIIITGPYTRNILPELLAKHNITVGFMPSICPETYSYVTHECMSLGLPMVAFPLGAQGECIGAWEHGLLAKDISPEKALDALRTLHTRYQLR